MQSDQNFYARKAVVPPLAYEAGGYSFNIPAAPLLDPTLIGAKRVGPFHGVELQASEVCPKNFIIFDHTDNKSRIMFHPALAHKLNCPSFDIRTTYPQQTGVISDKNDADDKESSFYQEDSKDIDALLSLDDEEEEDEEVSTGRAPGNRGSNSPDSCSTNGTKSGKSRLSPIRKSLSGGASRSSSSSTSERKRQKMRKMMKVLRGIVPDSDRMETAAVLDMAVKHLKSLKVEVKKLGLGNFKN
eukprot:TRINITY_DN648_c1_g1_i1.p1 TRINITY_DN648_c1_g1~~TRINITY_DN648_c1_g1_i1.p1  ORF type:complete len:243 (+),score=46.85 TRINITY_DN648_c1_g1_i1:302-1030(+)